MLQAVLSMFHSVQSILKSMQKQEDVYEEFVGQQDVTKEILEDVTKEVLEEKEERSHTDPTTTLVWVGLWQALTWLIPTHITCIQSWPSGTNVTN